MSKLHCALLLRVDGPAGCGVGTAQMTRTIPLMASNAVNQKTPARSLRDATSGPSTKANIKETPMLAPTSAIALVRCSSRVKSATIAITVLAIAPAPCSRRPSTIPSMLSAIAATTLPRANSSRPPTITGLRPTLSDNHPRGTCNSACMRPYTPIARPIRVGVAPGKSAA